MLRSRGLSFSVLIALTVVTGTARAQGFVEHLEPPVLERGKTTRVTLVGSQLGKAVGLWTSLPAGAVKATPAAPPSPTRAVLDVTVAADAPVGVCGVRLATVDGLANACFLLIDDLPVRPNPQRARPDEAVKVALPVSLWGRFREAIVDRFAIDVTAGERVSFEAVGNRLGKDVDPLITIRDARGKIVAEADNNAGLYFDFRFAHTFAAAGTYTVELCDARFHGTDHGSYVLRMGRFPAARVALPMAIQWSKRSELLLPGVDPLIPKRLPTEQEKLWTRTLPAEAEGLFYGVVKGKGDDGSAWLPMETSDVPVTIHVPGNSFADGTSAKAPGIWCGILHMPGERHYWSIDLAKGQHVQVRAEARAFNSPADLEIAIRDPQGKELRRAGESLQKEETILDFTAGAPGVYGIVVRDVNRDGGPSFGYRLDVRMPRPMVQVTADVEGLTVPQGDYQTVPLTVMRTDYAGPIALKLLGAPPGMTLTPDEIGEGVSAVVCKLAAGPEAPLGIHTLQIRAEPATGALPCLVRTRPLIDRQIVNVDLIPHALREDQLRLPPTLTDRFALQVTPPAFFTFELPEPSATLNRYQHVDFPLAVSRKKGFDGPIRFSAKGGQLAPKEEGRTRVYAEFTDSKGSIHSKILTNLTKHRVDVTALGVNPADGRRVALTRTFDLDIRAAFVVTAEPALVKLEPGGRAKLRLNADRMKGFDADVAVAVEPPPGIELPAKIVIPRGQSGVEVEVKLDANQPAARRSINWNATAVVNGFEEEQRGRLEIEIVKTAPPK